MILCLVALGAAASAQARPAADLIVTHADIYTVDRHHPKAEAVAVIAERIVAVGSTAEIDAWRGPHTQVIDAHGKLLLPGFNDSHVHFTDGGAALAEVQLVDVTSVEELRRRIAAQVAKTRPGEWILGGDWDETKWSPAQAPTAALIDDVTGQVPVFISRYDGHQSLANSAAMRLAGVSGGPRTFRAA
jgi:predicted amidohydrolase YtcJ